MIEANLLKRNGIGVDINPLACLIARVKTTRLEIEKLKDASWIEVKLNPKDIRKRIYKLKNPEKAIKEEIKNVTKGKWGVLFAIILLYCLNIGESINMQNVVGYFLKRK